jgi:hypothetical protein
MSDKKTAVFAIYSSLTEAERAVDTLVNEGLFVRRRVSAVVGQSALEGLCPKKNTEAPDGTTTGFATGGGIGGTLGLLAGIGALAIPGVGPFIAAVRSWVRSRA